MGYISGVTLIGVHSPEFWSSVHLLPWAVCQATDVEIPRRSENVSLVAYIYRQLQPLVFVWKSFSWGYIWLRAAGWRNELPKAWRKLGIVPYNKPARYKTTRIVETYRDRCRRAQYIRIWHIHIKLTMKNLGHRIPIARYCLQCGGGVGSMDVILRSPNWQYVKKADRGGETSNIFYFHPYLGNWSNLTGEIETTNYCSSWIDNRFLYMIVATTYTFSPGDW